jgi:N-methylhydantoinase A
MGGTSTDIGIIKSGTIVMSREGQVGEFPVVVPAVEITSIGAGGSSIAYRSPSGTLRVGPSSAGSRPGPACYGLGGDQATVTDALVMCGIISPSSFAGGNMSLSLPAAGAVLSSLGAEFGMGAQECADAIFRVAVAGLTLGVKGVMSRHGLDPREFSLLAFGGAGPVFAAYVAEELSLEQVVVPARPGTLCARGALVSPVRGDFVRTVYRAMADLSEEALAEIIASLEEEATSWLKQVEGNGVDYRLDVVAAMRYRGQAWEVDVPLDTGSAGESVSGSLAARFHEVHNRLYGHADSTGQVELIDVHASVFAARPRPGGPDSEPSQQGSSPPPGARLVRLSGVHSEAAIYQRQQLEVGQEIRGPAIIEQEDTTTVVPGGFWSTQDAVGNLILRRK